MSTILYPGRFAVAAAALLALGAAGPALAQDAPAEEAPATEDAAMPDAPTASGIFLDPDGETVGTATLTEMGEGVLIELELQNLPAGEFGFHIHETGLCDPEDGFESAGGHYNPTGTEHGYMAEGGPHAGDMPNQFVGEDGVLRAHVFNHMVTLGEGETTLLGENGTALMIHDGADDYASQPTGEAGGRLACAVIEAQ